MSDEIEERKLNFPVVRTPLQGVDVEDIASVRAWLLQLTEHRVRNVGRLLPRFRYLHAGLEEVFDVGEPDLGEEHHHAIFHRYLGQRPGVVRRFREGELRVEVDGSYRRAIVVMELDADDKPDAWWLAWRLIGEREGRVGVFYDEWVIAEGTGKAAFPEACADWFPRGEVVRSEMSEKPTELPMPEILVGLAPLVRPVPQDPMVVLQVVGQLTDAEIAQTGLHGIQVIAFRGLTVEQFIVRGRFQFDVDDFIRTVAQQGDNIDAIALIMVGVMQLDGLDTRAIIAVAEVQDGRRARRAMPLRFGPNGSIEPPRFWASEMPQAEPGNGWLGVAPTQDISLFPMPPKGQDMAES